MNEISIENRLTRVEEATKSAHKRINSMEKLTESVYKLAVSIENMQKEMTEYKSRLEKIEETPKKRWEVVVAALISAFVGYLIKGFLM